MSMFYMFVRVYDITYAKIQFNHSKLLNFIGSRKMDKTLLNFIGGFFCINLTKKMQRKPGVKCLVHSSIRVYDVTYVEFKTLKL